MTNTIHRDSSIFPSRQSKVADLLSLIFGVAFPAEEFVEEDVFRNPSGDTDVIGDEVAATFVMEAEPPALVEPVAGTFVGCAVGCAVLKIPARLSVTPTLSQFCMAKLLTSKRCKRRTVSIQCATYFEYLLASNPLQWQE